MSSIVQMLLLLTIGVRRSSSLPSCPASCLVCSDHAVICRRLTHIIEAPNSTQALLLTEGSISEVHGSSLSALSNITLIGLSHNNISVLVDQPFRNLSSLHTLLLDHNLLTSTALQGGALTNLAQLEVLSLSNNQINMIQGSWFQGSRSLHTLLLESNLLSELSSGSFPLNDLMELDTLDLSDNLITHLDTDSFRGLVSLRSLDLSRNRLSSAPAEAFSYLGQLSTLNLDVNTWNCSCQLLDLSAFLSSYMLQPDKVLYNGRRMVCVNADNPAVTTVLELTEANCVPSNHNITVRVEALHSVTPQRYARDVAIAAVLCFTGGVGLTLLVVLIHRVVVRRRKLLGDKNRVSGEEGGGANHTSSNHQDGGGQRRSRKDVGSQADQAGRSWGREEADNNHRLRSGAGEPGGGQLRCPTCRGEGERGPGMHLLRQDCNRTEAEEEREKRRMRMMMTTGEERRRAQQRQGVLNRNDRTLLDDCYPATQREPGAAKIRRETDHSRTDADGAAYKKVSCEICHKTYEHALTGQTDRPQYRKADGRGGRPPPSKRRPSSVGTDLKYLFDSETNGGLKKKREARNVTFERNVTFDLASPTAPRGGGGGDRASRASKGGKEKGRAGQGGKERGEAAGKQKGKVQSGRALRVKLNLNPLRRSKVSPKNEKSSSKKGKHPKGDKTKKSKSSRKKGSTEDDDDDEDDDDEDEDDEKSKRSSKKKKASKTKGREEDKGATAVDPSQQAPGDATSTTTDQLQPTQAVAGQQMWPPAYMQGPNMQGPNMQRPRFPFQGNVRQQGPPGSQPPFSTRPNFPMMPGMARPGSALSLQGGNVLGNMAPNMAPNMANPRFAGNPANIAPNMAYGGMSGALNPNTAPYGGPESHNFGRQGGFAPNPPPAAVLANPVAPINPLQSNPMQTSLLSSQPGGLPSNFAANPAANPTVNPAPVQSLSQTQQQQHPPSPDARRNPGSIVTSDPNPGPGLQSGDRPAAAAQPVPQTPPALVKSSKDTPPQPPQAQGPQVGGEVPSSPLAPRQQAPGSSVPGEENTKSGNILPQTVSKDMPAAYGGSSAGMPAAYGGSVAGMPAAVGMPAAYGGSSAGMPAAYGGSVAGMPAAVGMPAAYGGSSAGMPAASVSAGTSAGVAAPAGAVLSIADGSAVGATAAGVITDASAATGSVVSTGSETPGGATVVLQQTILSEDGGSSPKRKLRLILPEKASNRPPTALEKKIR